MRGLSFIVLALIAMLLVGAVILVIHPPSWLPQASAILSGVSSHASSDQGADRKAPAPEPPPVRRHAKPEAVPPAETHEASIPAPSVHTNPTYRFPLAPEIVTGSTRADILSAYGPPEATITGADLGRLQERLVYIEKSTRRKTLISILNGKVVAAQTYTE